MERTKNRLEINDNLQSGKCSKETAGRIFARYAKADLAVAAAILIGTQTFANEVERLYPAVQIPVNVYMDSNVQYGAGIGKFCALQNQNIQETVRELLELQTKNNTSEIEEILPPSDEIKNYEMVSVPAVEWVENETEIPVVVLEEAIVDVLDGDIQDENSLQTEVPAVPAGELTDEIQRNASDTSENTLEGLLTVGNFAVNHDGIIETCIDPYAASVDDTIIIPADERCTGIGALAFDKIAEVSEVTEVYIPANITGINTEAFDKLNSLIYIEVAEENPAYESIEGVLYDREGNVIVYPSGREEDA